MLQHLRSTFALSLCLLGIAAPSHAEIHLLTSIKPLQLIATAVQDGIGKADVLLPPGASAHHYALRPSDLRRVQDADLLYWIGPDMESFLPRVLSSRSKPSVAVQDLPQMSLRHFGENHADEHADEHEHEHEHEHETTADNHEDSHADEHDHDHRPGSLDAHLWLLPANARVIAKAMASDLSKIDPANAARYQANLQGFEKRLDRLEPRLQAELQPLAEKPYFVSHEAFEYFEAAYGLKHVGVFSLGSEVQPGARHVAKMHEHLQQVGASCVFSEPPLRPRLVETLSKDLPVTLAELDPMGTAVPTNADGYEQLLQNLADGLKGCLSKL